MKICVVGLAKSGTSALYSAIKEALPEPRRLSFEPETSAELRYISGPHSENALAKVMFLSAEKVHYNPKDFSHNIAIIRDPRDMLVSLLIYRMNRLELVKDDARYDQLLALFQKKEKDPRSVSTAQIFAQIDNRKALRYLDKIAKRYDDLSAFIKESGAFVLTYDQMIQGDLKALNTYLGLSVKAPGRLTGWVEKIGRKGESGDWQNWFTKDDVAAFQPKLSPLLARFGFDADWGLAKTPVILPEHCSEYIKRLRAARFTAPYRGKTFMASVEEMESAAEDGKVGAIHKLARYHFKRGTAEDRARAVALYERLVLSEVEEALFPASACFLAEKDDGRLALALEKAVALKAWATADAILLRLWRRHLLRRPIYAWGRTRQTYGYGAALLPACLRTLGRKLRRAPPPATAPAEEA